MKIFETINCPVCSSDDCRKLFTINYASNRIFEILNINTSIPEVSLFKCNNCFNHYANPQISSELIKVYYSKLNSEYYTFQENPYDFLLEEHSKIVRKIEKFKSGGKILEIGCGFGFLLSKFPDENWTRFGVEPSQYASDYAKNKLNLNIYSGFLNYSTYEPNSFDVIMLFDVIEHLKDADSMIELVNYYLKEEGLVVIGTGNIKSLNSCIAGNQWGYFGSWEHISFFSPESIKYLLEKEKLKLLKIELTSYSGSYLTNLKKLFINIVNIIPKNILKSFINKIRRTEVYKLGKTELTFDHMIVFAKKS